MSLLLSLTFRLNDARIDDRYIQRPAISSDGSFWYYIKAQLEAQGESVVYKLDNDFESRFHVLMRVNDLSEKRLIIVGRYYTSLLLSPFLCPYLGKICCL